jgi:uncharacterized protein DUF6559
VLRWIRKRLALRGYRRKLGPSLVKRYGRERYYTVNQVRVTVEKLGLNTDYICYAFADFCSREDFDAHHASTGEACDWAAMREELTSSWGIGDHHHHAADHGYDDGHHDYHHDDGGHHDGGFHDGGGHH